jgi:signal recognition particle subunit SEC65
VTVVSKNTEEEGRCNSKALAIIELRSEGLFYIKRGLRLDCLSLWSCVYDQRVEVECLLVVIKSCQGLAVTA